MNVLITGGAGMIGSHCAEYYAQKGDNVTVYDNLMRSKIFSSDKRSVEYNWNYLKDVKGVNLVKQDVRDFNALKDVFLQSKPDIVIHTAGQPGVRFSVENPIEDYEINCLGTVNVLEAVRQFNPDASVVYCSTNKVYGDNVNSASIKEETKRYILTDRKGIDESMSIDLSGHTPYGTSKLSGDLYVQDYAHTYGIKTAVFRMSCIYGTRQFGFEDQGWLAWFAIQFVKGGKVTIYGDGKQVRDVLWVDDVVAAYDKFVQSDLRHGVFNMGGGPENTLSLLELIEILERQTGKKIPVDYDTWRPFDQKVYISSIDKAKTMLKWSPTVTPEEGVSRLVSWVKDNRPLFN